LEGYGTFGSGGVRGQFDALRLAGAQARAMLICAASAIWHVKPGSVARNSVRSCTNRLAAARRTEHWLPAAAQQPIPANPPLKSPDEWRLIGRRCRGRHTGKGERIRALWHRREGSGPLDRDDRQSARFGGRLREVDAGPAMAVRAYARSYRSAMQSQLWLRTTGVLIEPFRAQAGLGQH